MPPEEMRKMVGPMDTIHFENSTGNLLYDFLSPETYRNIFDFGCGCGRLARQLMQQHVQPERYVGIDIHKGMIKWCQNNLSSHAPQFTFSHHNVFNLSLNPDAKAQTDAFPVGNSAFNLIIAHSIFTHLKEQQTAYYLQEASRILAPDGILISTWFLFDKTFFPMMQESQNTLFINDIDVSNAVIYDKNWLIHTAASAGLSITSIQKPFIQGFQWQICMRHTTDTVHAVAFPHDDAAQGINRPPMMPINPERIGL